MSTGHAIARPAAQRDPLERWYTPDHIAAAHVRWTLLHAPEVAQRPMHDPWAGGGAYLRAGRSEGLSVRGSDIAPTVDGIAKVPIENLLIRSAGWVCSNPPFSRLSEHLRLLDIGDRVISLHLPISALERTTRGNGRAWIWDEHPPTRIAHIGRVRHGGPASGGKGGGAAMCYVWVLWVPGNGATRFEWRTP